MFDVEIFGTGSEGNCACIDRSVIVDCGLPKGRLSEARVRGASAMLLTHEHSDHLNPATVAWACGANRALTRQLFMNASTLDAFSKARPGDPLADRVRVVKAGDRFEVRTRSGVWSVEAFDCPHAGIENVGFVFERPDGLRMIWATDVQTMRSAPPGPYDCACVEGNWDKARVAEAMLDPERARRAEQNLRHLSVQAFEDFVRDNLAPGGMAMQLHMSGEYGVRSGLSAF